MASIQLSTSRLSIGYLLKPQPAVLFDSLDLSLRAGELVCFMGPNGIGKSSLIRTLAGLQRPLAGEIHFPSASPRAEAIAVVLTDKISGGEMTVYDLVAFGRYPYLAWNIRLSQTDLTIVDRAIKQVRIEHLRDKKISELSDGQLQMAMIARAFAQDTPLILLDEPTAHLDLNNRVEIMKLLRSLARKTNKAILVSTHELDLALQMADLIWLAGKNKEILTGIPEDLVLQGAFDAIFQFKGFDLKTGKVQHEAYQSKSVCLLGEGSEYLWTKNALERNGYTVVREKQEVTVIVNANTVFPSWDVIDNTKKETFTTLAELLNRFSQTFAR